MEKKWHVHLHMSFFCCTFAADFEPRMDLTACNLVKIMLKLVPQDRNSHLWLFCLLLLFSWYLHDQEKKQKLNTNFAETFI